MHTASSAIFAWRAFLSAVENAQSPSDLEDIFEIDHFLKEMAFYVKIYDRILVRE